MLPETKLSHAHVLMDYWVGEHIGAEIALGGAQHIDAVRGPLTRSLGEKSNFSLLSLAYLSFDLRISTIQALRFR